MEIEIRLDESDKYADMIKFGIMRGLEAAGARCEEYAKDECPVVTGNLMGSITHQLDGYNAVIIGTPVEYALAVHEGHRQEPGRYVPAIGKRLVADFVPGKPFLRNAAQNHMQEYANLIKQSLEA